jgi:hypothetical protein
MGHRDFAQGYESSAALRFIAFNKELIESLRRVDGLPALHNNCTPGSRHQTRSTLSVVFDGLIEDKLL